jgi:hypothetical protein
MQSQQERTSIRDGKLESISVSAITKFDPTQRGGCYRKGHYHYVQGIEEPEGPGVARGKDTHAAIPESLLKGTATTDKLAKKAISWFNSNRRLEDCGFEVPFVLPISGSSIILVGRVDVKNDCEILDWKTTSKAIEELPSAASLIHTVQMPGYAKWLLDLYPRLKSVKLTHVYLSTKYDPYEVSAEFDREVILERWKEIEDTVEVIKKVVKLDIAQVEPNLKACDAFGGCFYRNICEYGKGVTKMGMMEELKKAAKTVEEVKPGPSEVGMAAIESVLPPDAPEPTLKKRGRPKKPPGIESDCAITDPAEDFCQKLTPTVFRGKVSKVSLGRTLNLGQFEGVRIDLEYQVEEGDHRAAFDYLRSEMRELEKYFKEEK